MEAGKLRHPVTIQTPTRTKDDLGGYTETWATLTETWAWVSPVSGAYAERLVGAKVAAATTHLITIRYVAGVTTSCRIVFGTRTFDVRGISNLDERDKTLMLACEERL